MLLSKKFLIILSFLLNCFIVFQIMAGTTGKIAGHVIDKITGKPLMGADIIVVGTPFGTATNVNGEYTILRLPPGVYSVTARFIGYGSVTISQVQVRIDQTTRIDFSLEETAVKGQVVTVRAKREVVKKDVTTSIAVISGKEAENLPMNSVADIVALQAGVEEGLNIRGGTPEEVLFQVNGITMRDPRNDRPITGIALSAIREISIERGGFNAEYGQVRSGIVNVVTKEGSKDKYQGTITLKLAPPAPKYFGISPYDPNSMWLRPYLDDAVCWTGTQNGSWDKYTQRQYPTFPGWDAVSRQLFENKNPYDDLTPAAAQRLFKWQHRKREINDQPDYNVDAGFGGPVPLIGQKLGNLRFFTSFRNHREMYLYPLTRPDYYDYDWSLQLTSDIRNNLKLRMFVLNGKSYNIATNGWAGEGITTYIQTPEDLTSELTPGSLFGTGYYSKADISHSSYSVRLTHVLSPRTYYEARVEYVSRRYRTTPGAMRDTTKQYEIIDGYFVDEAPMNYWWKSEVSIGDGMFFGGHTSTSRDNTKISSTTFKVDLTSQVDFHNLIKTGMEVVLNDLNFDFGIVNLEFPESNTWVKMEQHPIQGALYVQDKLETKGFILNAGLRLDYSNPNTEWPNVNPFDKSFFSANYDPYSKYPVKKVKPDIQLSPRLGISHPITENSKLFFNYGHFKQLPTYEEMFRLSRGISRQMDVFGDPSLALAKTISYELGFDHSLFDTYLIQAAAFYHDITDQYATTTYISADKSMIYTAANNDSYEDVRGFELTLRKVRGRWWTGFANYTYRVSTSGYFGTRTIYEDPSEQRKYNLTTEEYKQYKPVPQPYARVNLSFFAPQNFGPKVFGVNPFSGFQVSLLGEWASGWWGTWNSRNLPGIANNVHYKDWLDFTLQINKRFSFKNMDLTFFVEIDNLLNTRHLNLNSFMDSQDEKFYFESLHLPKSDAYNNIPGNDRPGDYRKPGVPYQPIERVGVIDDQVAGDPGVIYWESTTGKYMEYVNGSWYEVNSTRMRKILETKAYIDMPNMTSFNFLKPRRFVIGIRTNFNLK